AAAQEGRRRQPAQRLLGSAGRGGPASKLEDEEDPPGSQHAGGGGTPAETEGQEGLRLRGLGRLGGAVADQTCGAGAALVQEAVRDRDELPAEAASQRQAKAKTTKKDVRYRRLLVGLALLLRQAWVWLTAQVARQMKRKPSQWVALLPLER